jgi:1-phosphofructokinase family hexose kinase
VIACFNLNPAVDKTLEVPGFRVGAHVRVRVLHVRAAGKGHNVARNLADLGRPAAVFGFVGATEEDTFESDLALRGVASHYIPLDRRTRLNTTILDPESHTTTHLREPGFHVTPRDVRRLLERVRARLPRLSVRYAAICGSLPPGFSPDDLVDLILTCRGQGALVAVDTSGPALAAAVEARADIVKPNREELSELLGRALTTDEAPEAARTLTDRVPTVLVSLGADGGVAVTPEEIFRAREIVPPEQVVNNVGCGDAFMAGYLAAVSEDQTPAEAIRWAVACGAAAARDVPPSVPPPA